MAKTSASLPVSPHLLTAAAVRDRFLTVRRRSRTLARPLSPEDAQIQSMEDVSPAKWHLAHTTWFFETFILRDHDADYRPFDPSFHYLFNSYYEAEGARHPRPRRGMITRPGLARVMDYRTFTDAALESALDGLAQRDDWPKIAALIELGCHHEEQHQELFVTDIKHVLSQNPLAPHYHEPYPKAVETAPAQRWIGFDEAVRTIGHDGGGFSYDNETPRHRRCVPAFHLASRPVTNADYLAFIEDGGYRRPGPWLSDGWAWVQESGAQAPLYWSQGEHGWEVFTLYGRQPLNTEEPVCHLSYYEADAFANWAGARLPREEELETALTAENDLGPVNDMGSMRLHPTVAQFAGKSQRFAQLAGDVWEWTQSAYSAYPGFSPATGAVGEYNGKFMCNQLVLKGGSTATPPEHWRPSYRNFFPARARWQFSGLRLAKDA